MNKKKIITPESIYITERQLAERWNISYFTVQRWRFDGRGLPHIRIGKSIRYPLSVVENFEAKNTSSTASISINDNSSNELHNKWGLEWEQN